MGSSRSLSRRNLTIPSSALARTGGFLFLAAATFGAGSPWFDRLGLDPMWLLSNPTDSLDAAFPHSGVEARSGSDAVLRKPLRAEWTSTEITETFSQRVVVGPFRIGAWFQGRASDRPRSGSTQALSVGNPSLVGGTRAGVECAGSKFRVGAGGSTGSGQNSANGYLAVAVGSVTVETGGSRRMERSKMEISTARGSMDLGWEDISDSGGIRLELPLGPLRWSGSSWSGSSGATGAGELLDTGSASGWRLETALPTRYGEWSLGLGRDLWSLRTIGSRGGRVFHDQDWKTIRASGEAGWKSQAWRAVVSTRQIRLEFPSGGIDRPFVDWNMIPDDFFYRVGSVMESRSEYLDGSIFVEHWRASLDRNWNLGPLACWTRIGGSWTGIDASVERTTMVVEMLFPSLRDDVPVDGNGWLATVDVGSSFAWRTPKAGEFHAGGTWRQPFAGAWRSRALEDRVQTEGARPRSSNPVDPLGFHEWNVGWTLAL